MAKSNAAAYSVQSSSVSSAIPSGTVTAGGAAPATARKSQVKEAPAQQDVLNLAIDPATIDTTLQGPIENERMEVRDFLALNKLNGFFPEVRQNTAKYKFVTFLNKQAPAGTGAENVYFSGSKENPGAAATVSFGEAIGKGFFDGMVIMAVRNGKGALRMKLALTGEGSYEDTESLWS